MDGEGSDTQASPEMTPASSENDLLANKSEDSLEEEEEEDDDDIDKMLNELATFQEVSLFSVFFFCVLWNLTKPASSKWWGPYGRVGHGASNIEALLMGGEGGITRTFLIWISKRIFYILIERLIEWQISHKFVTRLWLVNQSLAI